MTHFQLETPRLIIRNLVDSDLEAFHYYRSNPEVTQYQGFDVMSLEEAQMFIKQNGIKELGVQDNWVQYGIVLQSNGHLIGDCAMKVSSGTPTEASIGITINPDYQQKGYANEVMNCLIKFLFETWKAHSIIETVLPDNKASVALLLKNGFIHKPNTKNTHNESLEHQYYLLNGK